MAAFDCAERRHVRWQLHDKATAQGYTNRAGAWKGQIVLKRRHRPIRLHRKPPPAPLLANPPHMRSVAFVLSP
jgi:hypothetical protein